MPQPRQATSAELGDGDFSIKYNKNGRPVRKSASQKFSANPAYVDSSLIDQQLLEITAEDLSEPESDFDSEAEREAQQKKKSKKRRRSPSPTPPPLSPLPPPDPLSESSTPEPNRFDFEVSAISIEPIHLTFNIEKGFSGPLHVQLDLSSVLRASKRPRQADDSSAATSSSTRKVKSRAMNLGSKGFLSLPAELRNQVYRLVFTSEKKIDFVEGTNMNHSSAFLRTCKQICAEGCSVLYGLNTFYFGRNKEMRRPFWNSERKEIGYKDLRLFLDLIGTANVSRIRHFWICFDDAAPSAVPHLKRSEERRYVHDPHLIESLKILAKHARLEKLTATFWGRRALALTDTRFLDHLTKIKADQIDIRNPASDMYGYYSWQPNRIHEETKTLIRKEVVRKHKLYEQ
ncbi:uncharacterized protein PV09_03535 [Verruconis gallopava]|uniref:Uncharacterized protein n=1 Tax=Verruconis gallopava TaxID=253628 RepID=A0A0D1YY95_9PEZI|nr:uncharacterized protein PV09_03535 [Verruconis gallopava]KIW05672.1 hypothetical protein PV09_03535 [Verruconis gallopava]